MDTLIDMPKKLTTPPVPPTPPADADRKKITVSLRFDPVMLAALDEYCRSQDIPLDRTAFIDVAVRRLMAAKGIVWGGD